MNDRDCESCKKFSHNDPYESEGYCQAKRTWVDPQEGEDCKMHEFTLHSATKYDDGTPIMSEPDTTSSYPFPKSNQLDAKYCSLGRCPYYDKFCDHTLKDKHGCRYLPHNTGANLEYLEQTFTEFAKTQDELIEEYDATLKTHGDTLEQHLEHIKDMDAVIATHAGKINSHTDTLEEHLNRICELEHLYEKVIDYVCELREKVDKIAESLIEHKGSNFCGNCKYSEMKDGICMCGFPGIDMDIVDPDSSSCSMFEPPF